MMSKNVYDPVNEEIFCSILRRNSDRFQSKIAVKRDGRVLTYGELNEMSDRVGKALVRRAVLPDDLVILKIADPVSVIISIVGLWKARAAFAYLDERAPAHLNAYIIENTKSKFVMDEVMLQGFLTEEEALQNEGLPPGKPEDLAVIIFTSGSTGAPKGVMIQQGAIAAQNMLRAHMGLRASDIQAFMGGFSFMAAPFQVFPILSAGGTLAVLPREYRRDLDKITAYYRENDVTVAFLPPHFARRFVQRNDRPPRLRLLLNGGEKVFGLDKADYDILGVYGCSEAGVVLLHRIDSYAEEYPLGIPIPHMKVYAVGEDGRPAAPGTFGEICCAGPQLAVGYLDNPELTAKKFTVNPFSDEPRYARLYHTGDIVKVQQDGAWIYEKRGDLMVNIHGFRIELPQVEGAMNQHPQIQRGVAKPFVCDKEGNNAICGYYLAEDSIDEAELRTFLRGILPHYMVPERFVHLTTLALTDTGKVDRQMLIHPDEYTNFALR